MAHTVMNSAGEVQEFLTGQAPQRPELEAPKAEETKVEAKQPEKDDAEDVEGEDGLTPRQKRELTDKMLKAVGKKHREMKEAQEVAASHYNDRRLAEARADELQREIERLKAQTPEPKVDPESTKPKREAYKSDDEYAEAIIDWKVEQKLAAEKKAELERLQKEQLEQTRATASQRVAKAIKLVPDFKEVFEAVDLRVPDHLAGYMQESEMLPELGYHFAKNPDVLEKLHKLSPARALVEIGKIESKLQPFSERSDEFEEKSSDGAKPSQAAKPSSSSNGAKPSDTGSIPSQPRAAAPVIQPLSASSASQVEKPPSKQTYAEAKAAYEKRHGRDFSKRARH